MKVLFGHQSVGANLLQGVAEHSDVRVVETRGPLLPPQEPLIAHFGVSRNGDPLSKIHDFVQVVDGLAPRAVQIALFKFCYVDVTPQTDVDALFKAYETALEALQARRPDIALAHITIPLRSELYGARGTIRRLLGQTHPERARNAARERFNRQLRDQHAARGMLFDLAATEAGLTSASNARTPALLNRFSDDGGHLNSAGRAAIAPVFLAFLRTVCTRASASTAAVA